jgi:hypothetical protein
MKFFNTDDDVEGDLDTILLNPVVSTIRKWRTFKQLRWLQLLNRLVDLDEIYNGGDDIEYNLDSVIFNVIFSIIPKWLTFKLLRWL